MSADVEPKPTKETRSAASTKKKRPAMAAAKPTSSLPIATATKEGPAMRAAKTKAPPPVLLKTKRSANIGAQPNAAPPTKTPKASAAARRTPKPGVETLTHSHFDALRLAAETFTDLQRARISVGNRRDSSQVDQEITGAVLRHAQVAEDAAGLVMRRTFRTAAPRVRAWVKETKGLGEHLMARLLGAIGDPAVANPMTWTEEPPEDHVCDPKRCGEGKHLVALAPYRRTVSQLWSFCGHGDPTRKRRKGMTQAEAFGAGNPHAKMLVHLMAECCMKCSGSPYRTVYDVARMTYATREGWTPLHQHNAALRKVGKEILRDLWIVANKGSTGK
jgi:hypothetical protein